MSEWSNGSKRSSTGATVVGGTSVGWSAGGELDVGPECGGSVEQGADGWCSCEDPSIGTPMNGGTVLSPSNKLSSCKNMLLEVRMVAHTNTHNCKHIIDRMNQWVLKLELVGNQRITLTSKESNFVRNQWARVIWIWDVVRYCRNVLREREMHQN